MGRHRLDPDDLDPGIRDAVLLLNQGGFKTFTSCEGGKGHSFRHETIGLELDEPYHTFEKQLVRFLKSHKIEQFTINFVTDYPAKKRFVYLEGLDLLSDDKRRRVLQSIGRKQRRLLQQLRERI